LTAETKYGGTVMNVKKKRVQDGGSSYRKTANPAVTVILLWIGGIA